VRLANGQAAHQAMGGLVLGEHHRAEAKDAASARLQRESLEQLGGQPLALIAVADDDRELRCAGIIDQADDAGERRACAAWRRTPSSGRIGRTATFLPLGKETTSMLAAYVE
jgi:hypothetical protein